LADNSSRFGAFEERVVQKPLSRQTGLPFKLEADGLSVGREAAIAFDIAIKEYLEEIDESPLLSPEQERALAKLVVEKNDPQARDRLVRSNLRLVVNIAKKYVNRGLSLSDLVEEGNLGLIKAVDYFDPDRGIRFSTYSAWWIKQSIKRALLESIQPIHIPTYMVALMNQWRQASAELESRLGRSATVEGMADIMRLPLRKAKVIHEVINALSSVKDASGSDDAEEGQTFEEAIGNRHSASPEDGIVAEEEKAKAVKLLAKMQPRETDILRMHYGLGGNKPLSLKEIGKRLGLTRERVRQIQHQALTKLYEYMNE
jgi:RNA polymerase sigma factor (sigma-70 family)